MSSRKPGREGSTKLRPVASFRRSSNGRGGMFFGCGMQQRRLLVLVVTALAALLVSGCGGGDGASQEQDSAEDTITNTEDTEQATTTGNTRQAPEDACSSSACSCSSWPPQPLTSRSTNAATKSPSNPSDHTLRSPQLVVMFLPLPFG